jgi:histidyl-tRNA synthetase
MKTIEPRILSGFMELLPEDQILFNEMLDVIRKTYESFGFLPLDTPVIELSEVLLAKAGGETEKQIYRFNKGENDLSLRFDLTVPLARFVAMHKDELVFPFKRYQIGKVYRGERAQRGRFREFYQCDIDVIGKENLDLLEDAEIPAVIYNLFKKLNIGDFYIRCNNRKIMNGFINSLKLNIETGEILRLIDKWDKIGEEEVIKLFKEYGLTDEEINSLVSFVKTPGNNLSKLNALKLLNINNELFLEGLNEMEQVINYISDYKISEENFIFDLTITRGLDYYTGTVYETFLKDNISLGSICSGGRYDNLASYYTEEKLPGIGISIGLTRLFYQLKESNLIKLNRNSISKVFVIPMEESNYKYSINISNEIRNFGINTELCNTLGNFKSKMKYADRLKIPFVIIIGSDEESQSKVTLKNMENGEQNLLSVEEAIEVLK